MVPCMRSGWMLILLQVLFLAGCATQRLQRVPPRLSTEERETVEPVFAAPSRLTALSISPYTTFKAKIDSLLPDSLFPPAHVGIKIVSLRTRETLYELNASSLFNPGSNQKLLTSAAALKTLGSEFELPTVVGVDTSISTIVLKGFGDALCTVADLDLLAGQTAALLPRNRSWKVAADDSYFDIMYWGLGWNWDDEPWPYQPFLSPLIVNLNSIRLIAAPGAAPDSPLVARTNPATGFVRIENRGRTVAAAVSSPLKLSRTVRDSGNVLIVEGEMTLNAAPDSTGLSITQPALYATHLFVARLKERGVQVTQIVLDTATHRTQEIARVSHRMDSVVVFMNKESDNLSAEALLKVLGAEAKGNPGSAEAGAGVVKGFLASVDIDTSRMKIADGSGLSRMNLCSPSAIVRLLEVMYDSPEFETFLHSLPIAGVDGTLEARMRGSAAAGNVRAKTGTLTAVSAVSGYLQTADGEPLAFSIMMMNYPAEARVYRRVQDQIGIFLSRLTRAAFAPP